MSLARVRSSVFAARKGKTLTCEGCRQPIEKGTRYNWFKVGFRSRYVHAYHAACRIPDASRASGKMAGVYSANEAVRDTLAALSFTAGDDAGDIISEIESALETAADDWRSVGDEYREAAEASPTGYIFGVDYNEVADTFDSAADELTGWSPDDDEPDYEDCDNIDHDPEADEPVERGSADCDGCADIAGAWLSEVIDSAETHMDDSMGNIEVG
jgi:hypothetical protein